MTPRENASDLGFAMCPMQGAQKNREEKYKRSKC